MTDGRHDFGMKNTDHIKPKTITSVRFMQILCRKDVR